MRAVTHDARSFAGGYERACLRHVGSLAAREQVPNEATAVGHERIAIPLHFRVMVSMI